MDIIVVKKTYGPAYCPPRNVKCCLGYMCTNAYHEQKILPSLPRAVPGQHGLGELSYVQNSSKDGTGKMMSHSFQAEQHLKTICQQVTPEPAIH